MTSLLTTKLAFYDELEKISVSHEAKARRGKLKRWVKNTMLVAAGTGAGTGAYMLGERALKHVAGKKWGKLSPKTQRYILGPASSLATMGGAYLAHKLLTEKRRKDEE